MDQDWTQIIAAVTGGLIAGGTGWFIDWKRETRRLDKLKKLLITGICDDLHHSLNLYDKIEEEFYKTNTIYFATLNELKESRYVYKNNKDWMTIFENELLRKKIFKYYLESGDTINMLDFQQRRKYEIEKTLNDTTLDLKKADPSLDDQSARKTALGYMTAESGEYDNLCSNIPRLIARLKEFKHTAENLIERMAKP